MMNDAPDVRVAAAPRASEMRSDARWRLASRILLAATLLLIAVTFRDYGMTWDEEHSSNNGRFWVQWYASGFSDRSFEQDNQRLYGSLFNGPTRLLSERSPLGLIETGHLISALVGWVALWAACGLATHLMGARAGFFAALALVLTPGWYGHTFNNPKDVPFAVLFVVALWAIAATYRSLPRPRLAQTLLVGLTIGLALGVRVGAIVLLGCYAMLFVCWLYARVRSGGYAWGSLGRDTLLFAVSSLGALLIAWLVMLPWWPYAQLAPIANTIEALKESARFQFTAVVLYHGGFLPAQDLPWHYLPRWFSKTLPDFYLALLLGVGVVALVERLRAGAPTRRHDLHAQLAFVAVAAIGLPTAAVLTKAVMYDAYRHFLFAIPPLAVLAGCGVSWLLDRPARPMQAAVLGISCLLAVVTLADMIALHPYQTVYFNRLNGGLPKAAGRYETDYWGASHREGVEWLAANYRPDAAPQSIRVANSAVETFTGYYIRGGGERMRRFVSVEPSAAPDVVLSITRWKLHEHYKGRVIHTITRMGVPLLYVIEMPKAEQASARE
jgi:hypothetical protein